MLAVNAAAAAVRKDGAQRSMQTCCGSGGGGTGTVPRHTLNSVKALPALALFWQCHALLKGSCGCGEEHEIVSEDTQNEFAPLSLVSSRGQR
jgi:hypothetical protein